MTEFQRISNQISILMLKNENGMTDLTNIERIERLECIAVFTEVAAKLSGKVHLFYDTTQQR